MAVKLDRTRRRAVTVLLAIILWGVAGHDTAEAQSIGRVVGQVGEATLVSLDRARPVRTGIDVEADDRVVTGVEGKVQIRLVDGSMLTIGPQSEVAMADLASPRGGWVDLVRGIVRFIVAPGASAGETGVRTRAAVASVRSTEFVVDATLDRTAVLAVRGQVEISGRLTGTSITLGPGEGTDVALRAPPTAPKHWGAKRVQDAMARTTLP